MERKELTLIEPENGNALSIPVQQKAALTNAAALAADVAKIVRENGLSKKFGSSPKEHVFVEGWLTISRVNNEAPHAKVDAVETHGDFEVIKARAWITDAHGNTVSEADGYCSAEEPNWKGKPFYARASMAQTRAIGKAMRLRHAWVMVMAGFSPTPAEEMDGVLEAQAEVRPAPKASTKPLTRKVPPEESKLHPPDEDRVPAGVTDGAEPTVVLDGERVTVLKVSTKTGEKNGKPWTRFGIQVRFANGETDWLNTFSSSFGELAQKNVDAQLVAKFDVSEYNGKPQYNLTDLQEVQS